MTTLRGPGYSGGRSLFGGKARWMVALVLVIISIITYCSSTAYNSVPTPTRSGGLSRFRRLFKKSFLGACSKD